MLNARQIKEIIIKNEILSEKELKKIISEAKKNRASLEEYLYEKKF